MMMSSANGPVTSLMGKTPSVGRSTGLAKSQIFLYSSVLFSGKMSMGSLMKKMLRRKNMDSLISRWKHATKGAGLWPILTTVESSTFRYRTQA